MLCHKLFVFISLFALILAFKIKSEEGCDILTDKDGQQYDLNPLRNDTSDYILTVSEPNGERPTYLLNFCRPTIFACGNAERKAGFCRVEDLYVEPLGIWPGTKINSIFGEHRGC